MPIGTQKFSGHQGYVVAEDKGKVGELDPSDVIVRKPATPSAQPAPVSWDDPSFVRARASFERLSRVVDTSNKSLATFEAALEPRPRGQAKPKKPERAALEGVIAELKTVTDDKDTSGALRSDAQLLMAWAEGVIARDYTRFFWQKKAPGVRAFQAVQKALAENPKSDEAWTAYGMAILGIQQSFFKGMAESALGVDCAKELPSVIRGLATFPDDLQAQTLLDLVLTAKSGEDGLSADESKLRTQVRARLPGLRAADPAATANADKTMAKLKAAVKSADSEK